jgi:hypothetical protein
MNVDILISEENHSAFSNQQSKLVTLLICEFVELNAMQLSAYVEKCKILIK